MKKFPLLFFLCFSILFIGCNSSSTDTLVATMPLKNVKIYIVYKFQPTAKYIAVKGDRILYAGDEKGKFSKDENTKVIDLQGSTYTSGLLEGQTHFMGIGYNEMNLDLLDRKN